MDESMKRDHAEFMKNVVKQMKERKEMLGADSLDLEKVETPT